MDGGVHASDLQLSEEWVQRTVRRETQIATLMCPAWSRLNAGSGALYAVMNRIFDWLFVIAALTAAAVMLLVALAIKLARRGLVLFSHQRTGRHGKRFNVFKFRTMVVNAEARKAEFAPRNELKWPDFKMMNDPRVTRIGRFLQRTSLDKLPHLYNILTGEMSLVGPRPRSITVGRYQLCQKRRLDVTPGMTGPAQVWRLHADFPDKCELDIAYIEHRSLLLDLYLIYRTARMILLAPSGK